MGDEECIDQADIDKLLAELASSGSRLAAATDGRYDMSLRRRGGVMWLTIDGMVMQPVPDEFTTRLQQVCDNNQIGHAVVDLRNCVYLCSSALGVLAIMLQSDRTKGGKVLLLGASDKIQRMMSLVGLGELFHTVDSEAAAVRYWLGLDMARKGFVQRKGSTP